MASSWVVDSSTWSRVPWNVFIGIILGEHTDVLKRQASKLSSPRMSDNPNQFRESDIWTLLYTCTTGPLPGEGLTDGNMKISPCCYGLALSNQRGVLSYMYHSADLKDARLGIMITSPWNLTGVSAALPTRRFEAIENVRTPVTQLQYLMIMRLTA